MSFAITTGAIALVGTGAQIYSGIRQRNQAKRLREQTQDPGIQRNYALDRVTNTLFQNYSNFNLPGYNNYVQQVNSNMASANQLATQGATSSADILNAVTANQAVADQSLGNLTLQNASGREQALMRYLSGVEQQGQDQLRVNNQELERYNQTMAEAAALEGASMQNINSGIQDSIMGISAISSNFIPRQSIDFTTGQQITLPSVWDSYRNRRRGSRNRFVDASLNTGGVLA